MPSVFMRFFFLIAIAIAASSAMKSHAAPAQEKAGHEARLCVTA